MIRRYGFFKALVERPDTFEEVCLDYLASAEIPSIPGLAAYLGATVQQFRKLFDVDTLVPKETQALLANVITQIEAKTVEQGLVGRYNASVAKFVLSVFHERHEKQLSETRSEKQVTVTINTHTPITLEELREMDRLEGFLASQRIIELAQIGATPAVREDQFSI